MNLCGDIDKKSVKDGIITKWKLDFIFKYIKNNQSDEKTMGMIELNRYFYKIYDTILTKEEKKQNKLYAIKISEKTDDNKYVKSLLYKIKRQNDNLYYIYDSNQKGFIEIKNEELKKLSDKKGIIYESKYDIPKFEDGDERE